MPIRKGFIESQNLFIDTIIRRFDGPNRSFMVGNATDDHSTIFVNEGFCRLTGYSRADVVQKPCTCEFLHGPSTSSSTIQQLQEALLQGEERTFEMLLYKKNESDFLCQVTTCPIKNNSGETCLYLVNFEDLTAKTEEEQPDVVIGESIQSKFSRARASFRQSLRLGQKRRGRNLHQAVSTSPQRHMEPILDHPEDLAVGGSPPTALKKNDQKYRRSPTRAVSIDIQELFDDIFPQENPLDSEAPKFDRCSAKRDDSIESADEDVAEENDKGGGKVCQRSEEELKQINCEILQDNSQILQVEVVPDVGNKISTNSKVNRLNLDLGKFEDMTDSNICEGNIKRSEIKKTSFLLQSALRQSIPDTSLCLPKNLSTPVKEVRKTSLPLWKRKDPGPRKDSSTTINFLNAIPRHIASFAEGTNVSRISLRGATSLDAISHHRVSFSSGVTRNHVAKSFPNASSESDLSKFRARFFQKDRQSPSLSILTSDGIRQRDGNSKGIFPNTKGHQKIDKVAHVGQVVLSLGADVLPEYKLQSPRIHRWTILHYSPFKAVWDWIILLLVIYTAIFTPYVAAFLLNTQEETRKANQAEHYRDPIVIIDIVVDIMFMIDIAINFRTTYVNSNDEVVSHPGKIALHYLRGWFLIDMVAAIPLDLFLIDDSVDLNETTTTLMGLLKTARLLRLVRVARKIDRYSEYGAAVLLLLMATFALIAHWLACIWYAIGNAERPGLEYKIGWLDHLANDTYKFYYPNNTGGPSLRAKYVTALYFTFSSLTSVGFGNVAATTDAEKIFTILVMLIGSLMYASIFGNVSAIIQRLYAGTARYHTQMIRVKEFVRFHQVPNPLRQRLEDYFQHAWSYTNGIDMGAVMTMFPECIQADVSLHLNRNLFERHPAFEGASPGCLRALSMKFRTTHAPPGDTLAHKGDVLTSMYFIARGSIEILKDDVVMAILGKNDIFGEHPCMYSTVGKSSCNVRSLTYCDLHRIMRDEIWEVLDLYPEFAESFARNIEITFNLRDDSVTGVDPKLLRKKRYSQESYIGEVGELNKPTFRLPRPRRRKMPKKNSSADESDSEGKLTPGRNALRPRKDNQHLRSGDGSPEKYSREILPYSYPYEQKTRSATFNSITGALSSMTSALGISGRESRSASRCSSPGPQGKEDAPLLTYTTPSKVDWARKSKQQKQRDFADSGSPDHRSQHYGRHSAPQYESTGLPKTTDIVILNNRMDGLSRQVQQLETKLCSDINQILNILQQQSRPCSHHPQLHHQSSSSSQPDSDQARSKRKCRSPQTAGSTPAGLDPWTPRREDSWSDFKSLTDAPIARLESLDEMESLPDRTPDSSPKQVHTPDKRTSNV